MLLRMAKKRVVRRHRVEAKVDNIDLTKAGTSITLEVYADAEKIGTAELGRGTLRWRGGRKRKLTVVDWTKFAEWMEGNSK
jgi:hypothetical protein